MRYDHSKTISLQTKAAPGESVDLPSSIPSFHKPTYAAGMAGLIFTNLAYLTFKHAYNMPNGTEMVMLLFTVPTVTICMILSVWRRGELKSWYMYSET